MLTHVNNVNASVFAVACCILLALLTLTPQRSRALRSSQLGGDVSPLNPMRSSVLLLETTLRAGQRPRTRYRPPSGDPWQPLRVRGLNSELGFQFGNHGS
ncbi:MAG TPA: hypothetical protein VIX37_03765, partial [Candidatus Sulfotelmatobacter sp.]